MKTLIFIISIVMVLSTLYSAYADPLTPKTLSDLYKEYKLIIQGQVISISKNPEKNLTSYDVNVNEYLKNPQQAHIITATYDSTKSTNYTIPTFNVGDNVQLYLTSGQWGNTVSQYSFKMDKKCGGLGPNTLSTLPGISIPATNTRFLDSNGDVIIPSINREFFINPNFDNSTPLDRLYVEISIKLQGNSSPIFYDKRQIAVQPCSNIDYTWAYTPKQEGNYTVEMTRYGGLYDNKIIFGNYSLITMFSILKTPSGNDMVLSPLKQLKSGITAKDVVCNQGLQLIIKSEDGFPACVKSETSKILVERGWAKPIQ